MELKKSKGCVCYLFTNIKFSITCAYNTDDTIITRVKLGVLFDSTLSFRPHYDYITSKVNKTLGFVVCTAQPFRNARPWITLFNVSTLF